MSSLDGTVIVLTGASSGIGAASARLLAANGARLMLAARREDNLRKLCTEIGANVDYCVTDMRHESDVDRLVDTAVERFGKLDAIVNNAAYGTVRTIADGRSDEWRATIETNFLGVLSACRAALRHMLPQRHGSILNVTSASAHEAWPYLSVYAASKAAIHTVSDGLRCEVAPQGIRVMTLEVHNIAGTDFASSFDRAVMPAAVQSWEKLGLLRRDTPMLTPDDAARAILFQLAQPDPVSIHHLTLRSRGN
jgi:NADP-dependent 3-hydroxy acid dehydrogenase YdfG